MRWLPVALVAIAGVGLLAQQQKEQKEKVGTERLAAGSGLIWVHVPDCKALRQDWRKGFLAGLLFEKEMKPFFEKMAKKHTHPGHTFKQLLKQQMGIDIMELLKGFEGELLLHLRDIETQPAVEPQAVGDVLKFLFALQVGEAAPVWSRFIEKLTSLIPELQKGEQDCKGTKIKWIGAPQVRIYHALYRGVLLGSFDLDTMTQAIGRGEKGAAASSIYTQEVKTLLEGAGVKTPRIVVRLGIRSLIDTIAPLLGPQQTLQLFLALAGEKVDLSNLLFVAEPLPEGGYREVLISKLTEEGLKEETAPITISKTLLAKPEDIYLLAFPEAVWAKTMWGQFKEQLKQQEEMLRRWDPQAKGAFSKLKEMEKALGFKIEDLANFLGTGALYVVRPPGGGAFPEAFLALNLRDPATFRERFGKTMTLLVQQGILPLKEKQFGGHTFWMLELPKGGEKTPFGQVPWAPTWGVAEGKLLVASSPLTMKSLLKAFKKPKQPDKFLADFLKRASGSYSASYFNLPSFITYLYNTLIPLAQKGEKDLDKAGIDLDLLPDAETVASHFPKVLSFSRRKGKILYNEVITDKGFGFVCDMMSTMGYILLAALGYEKLNPQKLGGVETALMQKRVTTALSVLATAQALHKIEKKRYASSVEALIEGNFLTRESVTTPTHKIKIISADDKSWAAVAIPLPNSPIKRHYYTDQTGVIRYSDSGPADSNSPVLEPGNLPPVKKPAK